MYHKKILSFYLLLCSMHWLSPNIVFAQDNCRTDVISKAQQVNQLLSNLPAYTDDREWKRTIVQSLSPTIRSGIEKEVQAFVNSSYSIEDRVCFNDHLDKNGQQWWGEFIKQQAADEIFGKQSFEKGGFLMLSLKPLGGSGISSAKEAFMSSYFVRYGRSIGNENKERGRAFRWVVGPGLFHQKKNFFVAAPGIQYRIGEVTVLGSHALSFIGEANYLMGLDDAFHAGDVGFSIESFFANINVITIGYQNYTDAFYFQSGIQILLFKN